jgi:hypothetical protein
MAEMLRARPSKVRQTPVELPGGRVVRAHELDDVAKQIIFDMKVSNGWTWPETAHHIGLTPTTLAEMMQEEEGGKTPGGKPKKPRGMTLSTLSKIVAARSHNNPLLFFQRHPLFRGKAPQAIARELATDAQYYDRLCALLTGEQANMVADILEALLGRGALDDSLRVVLRALGVEEPGQRRAPRKKSG